MVRLGSSGLQRVLALSSVVGVTCAACGGAPKPVAVVAAPAKDEGPPPPPPAGPPVQVDCGDFTTCATSAEGAVRCWGHDKKGELGDGGGGDRPSIVEVKGLGKVKALAMASQFACALVEGGSVKCWGSGLLANDGQRREKVSPTAVAGVADVDELVASGVVACARSKGKVTCWGSDAKTLGEPPKGELTQVSAGFTHACALDKTGAVVCWGSGEFGPKGAFAKPAIKGALQVSTGDRHACVVTKDHKVLCWGQNDAGQLGIKPDIDPHKKPVDVPGLKDVRRVVCGESSTCALLASGEVSCWGANGAGELGLGTSSPDERPSKVSALSGVSQLCIATQHACALTAQGVSCWGQNNYGQVGDGTREKRLAPTPVKW